MSSTPTSRPGPPPEVRTAVRLWIGSLVVAVAAAVVSVVVPDGAVRDLVRAELVAEPALQGVSQDTLVRLVSILGVVLAVVWAGLKLVLVLLVRSGRGWARTALTVVGAVGVISCLLGLREVTLVEGVLGLLGSALVIAAVIAAHSGEANTYLAPRRSSAPPG